MIAKQIINEKIYYLEGERRDLNPRIMESQSNALPLGHARHIILTFSKSFVMYFYVYLTETFFLPKVLYLAYYHLLLIQI